VCQAYQNSMAWEKAVPHCEDAALLGSTEAGAELSKSLESLWNARQKSLLSRLNEVHVEIAAHHLERAEAELALLKVQLGAQQFRLDPTTQQSLFTAANDLAAAKYEWIPAWLRVIAFHGLQIVVIVLLVALFVLGLAPAARWMLQKFNILWYRLFGLSVWRVLTVTDKTDQNAIGAVMDALNHNFNPLFQPVTTSSFLAIPPGLLGLETAEQKNKTEPRKSLGVFRNFLVPTEELVADVRAPLSFVTEFIDRDAVKRHRFKQSYAFEDDTAVKIGGYFEASVGKLFKALRNWIVTGMPAVTGAINLEDIDQSKYAQIRLVASWGQTSFRNVKPQSSDRLPRAMKPSELFASGQTL
jgi:hypothetical protein